MTETTKKRGRPAKAKEEATAVVADGVTITPDAPNKLEPVTTKEIAAPKKPTIEVWGEPRLWLKRVVDTAMQLDTPIEIKPLDFVYEECMELLTNDETGAHDTDKALLVDDIVDVLWVTLQAMSETQFNTAQRDLIAMLNGGTIRNHPKPVWIKHIKKAMRNVMQDEADVDSYLYGIVYYVAQLALISNVKLEKAFAALCDENWSKLNYPEEKVVEVFRNNRINKKDDLGNAYPWYKPASFNLYI